MKPHYKSTLLVPSPWFRSFSLASALLLTGSAALNAATDTWSGSVNGTWNTSTLNWNAGATAFTSGDDALFTGTPANNVTNATGLTVGALTLDGTFTGSVALTGANTVNGATTVSAGTLALVNATALGTSAATVNSPGLLWLESPSGGLTYANNVSGTGTVKVSPGTDTLQMSGDLSGFTGTVDVFKGPSNWGKLAFSGGSQPKTIASSATIKLESGATLYLNQAYNYNAAVQLNGGATLEAFGNLRLESGAVQAGPVTLYANSTVGANSGTGTISGNIGESGGSFGFTKQGGATLALTGNNTYSGGTTISGGTVSVGNNNALGRGTVAFAGGTVSDSTAVTLTNNFSTATSGGTFSASGGAMVLTGNITGGNTLTLNPANQITLAGTNSFGTSAAYGNLSVNAGAGGVDITGSTTVGSGNSANAGGYINVAGNVAVTVQAGGSLSILGTSNSSKPGGIIGQNTAGTSSLTVNGGSLTIGGNLGIAFGNNRGDATGVLTVTNSGTATIMAGSATLQDSLNFIALGRDNATGIINLAAGTLATGRQFVRDGSNGGTQGSGTATFNFNGGKLQALASQTAGNGWFETATSGNFQVVTTTVMDNGAIIDNNGFDVNINTVLAHGGVAATDGGVTKLGLGTLTLGGANTYNGSTVVSNGTLQVSASGSLNAASAVTVAGGNLVNAGSIGGTVTVNARAKILPSTGTFGGLVTLNSGDAAINLLDATAATVTFANGLTLNNGNQLSFDLGGWSSDQIYVSGGSFTHSGTVTLNLNATSPIFSGTTYTLIADAASDINSTTGFTIGTQPSGYTATLGASGGALTVTLTQNAPSAAYWKGGLGNAWNSVSGGTANWTTDATGTANTGVPPGTPSSVIFAATGAANFNTVLGANFTINDLTLSTANNVTIGGATNTLTIVSGLLNDTTALSNTITVSNVVLGGSQTWQNNSANPLTVSSMISGTPALTIGGRGSIILTSTNNNCSGGTAINSGTLQLGDGTANDGTVAGNINNNSALVFANPSALTFSGQLDGYGTLTKSGAGTLILNHAGNTYSGTTTVSQGQLTGNTLGSATGTVNADVFGSSPTITVNNGATLFIDDAGNGAGNERDLVVASALAGSGAVRVRGADTHDWDTVVLNGDLSGYTGTIQVLTNASHRGKLRLGNTLPSAAAIAVADGTTLYLNTALDYPNAVQLYGAGNVENMGALRLEGGATLSGALTLFGNTSIGANTGTETISGAISESGGSYGFTKLLGGTLTLAGANTHSGTTTMSSGTLNLANGSALQNSTLNLAGGSLVFDGAVASNAFVLGGLSGTVGISLANSYSSPITLTVGGNGGSSFYSGILGDGGLGGSLTKTGNGTLTLSGANTYSGTTTVAGGKLAINTLQTNATAGIVVNDGATLTVSAVGTNQLAPASYTLGTSTGATNEFSGLTSTTVAPVNAGLLTLNGTIRVNIAGGAFASGNTYPLIAYTSISGSGGFVLGSLPRGMSSASIVTNGGNTIALKVIVGSTAVDVWTGVVNTNWDISTTTNWLVGGNPDIFLDGDIARFDDTSSQTNVYVTTAVQPLSTVVSNATKTYTLVGTGIAGSGSLTKQGNGTLVLAQANTYTGNTVISNGTLKVATASAIPNGAGKGDVVLGSAGVLDVNATSITLNGLSGNGAVDTVAGGNPTLTVGNNAASSTFSGTLQNSSGTLALTKTGNGTLTLSGATNAMSGQLQINGGTLNWNTVGALAPSAGDYRPLSITAGATLNVNGSLQYSSGTAGVNGYLNIGNNAVGGYGTININSGGVLTFTNQTGNPNSIVGQLGTGGTSLLNVNGGTFNWDGSSGLIIGNGGGSGVLLITNGGKATILKGTGSADEGYLALGRDGASSSGTLYLANGTLATDRVICQGSTAVNGTGYVLFDGGTLKALSNQSDWLQATANGNAQPPSAVTINAGGAVVDANGFLVAINNNLASGASPDGGLTLVDSSAGKNGVLTLGGTCAYNGPTIVSNGTLLMNGSTSTGATTVNGGTLGGTGTLGGSMTVNSGASFAPGSSGVGTLTVTGDIVLNAGSTNIFDVDGSSPGNNAVAAGGAVTYGGVLKIVPAGIFTSGQTFTLFSGAGAASASNFSSIQGSPGSGLGFSFTNGVLSVVSAGPSGPALLTNSIKGSTLSLSWPAGQGWRLQMQTNSLATGLSSNWVYVTDGSVSSTNITVDPTKPTVFFRLRYP